MISDFCTYFDSRYLVRALALHASLLRHAGVFRLWVLCMDDAAADCFSALKLEAVRVVRLRDLETADPDLHKAKSNRSAVEYMFTCTPCLPLHVFRQATDIDMVTYLDSDLFFFADPRLVSAGMGDASIGIIEHRYSKGLEARLKYGRFNVGWNAFRRDEAGIACLKWWRERCLEWCYDRCEPGRFADQGYLDAWPALFKGVRIIENAGANVAPWNVDRHQLEWHGGVGYSDGVPLLFYHFQSLRSVGRGLFDTKLSYYNTRLTPVLKKNIYRPYAEELIKVKAFIENRCGEAASDSLCTSRVNAGGGRKLNGIIRRLGLEGLRRMRLLHGVVRGDYFFV
jgi:hypothetical protein